MFQEAIEKGTLMLRNPPSFKRLKNYFDLQYFFLVIVSSIKLEDFVDIYTACFPDKDVQNEAIETILLSKVVGKLEVKTSITEKN